MHSSYISLLFCLLPILFCHAHTESSASSKFRAQYGFGTESPKLTSYPPPSELSHHRSKSRFLEGGKPTLKANTSSIKGLSETVSVHYNDVEFTSPNDWIGMWPLTDDYTLFSSPLKFKFVCESCRANVSADPTNPNPPVPGPNGTVTFNVINQRLPVFFIYVHGSAQYPESLARSQNIEIDNPRVPQGGHLSLVRSDPTKMRLQWSSFATTDPHVKYGSTPKKYTKRTECCNHNNEKDKTTISDIPYTVDDMCDRDVQPAGLHGWFPPPSNYTALFENLIPNTKYYYVYGSDEGGWSSEKSFVSAPRAKPSQRTVMAAFGDMGNTESDGSYHHSWDFDDRGEIPSSNTTKLIGNDDDIQMVLHIGDISYACGFLAEWDNFFNMIEPVATKVPWMTGIGNHEQGWSKGYFPGTDSGGECGVPYNAYFPFASQNPSSTYSERKPWYDFSYGNVHTVVFSTEHDFTIGSPQ
jgi:acid phosphatase type 7